MKVTIAFTKVALEYGWLGNMAPSPIMVNGVLYHTAEHLFQSLRLGLDHPDLPNLLEMKSPMAFKMAIKVRDDDFIVKPLSSEDLENMRYTVYQKFKQNPDLAKRLLETGDAKIIEDVTSRANRGAARFWGAERTPKGWYGQNKLGKILMDMRDEIRERR